MVNRRRKRDAPKTTKATEATKATKTKEAAKTEATENGRAKITTTIDAEAKADRTTIAVVPAEASGGDETRPAKLRAAHEESPHVARPPDHRDRLYEYLEVQGLECFEEGVRYS